VSQYNASVPQTFWDIIGTRRNEPGKGMVPDSFDNHELIVESGGGSLTLSLVPLIPSHPAQFGLASTPE
jgi:hypothetical protein